MKGAFADPSMTTLRGSREAITGQAGSVAVVVHPDAGHAAYVPNSETMKPESEMTVDQGGDTTNENPGGSADTESEVSAVPVDAMAAECPSRQRRRSNILSRCPNHSTSRRAFRNVTTEVLSSKLTNPGEFSKQRHTDIDSTDP